MKPCPFCGGSPVLTDHPAGRQVACSSCGVSVGLHATEEKAKAAWNRRRT